MKTLLFVALAAGALSLASCKKNKCQTCTTRVTQNVQGINVEVSAQDEDYCGDNYDNVPTETSVNQQVNGITQTVTVTCQDK